MEIMTLETLDEVQKVGSFLKYHNIQTTFIHIGAAVMTPYSKTEWYWIKSNEKISYDIPWDSNQPERYGEGCLSVKLKYNGNLDFHDMTCSNSGKYRFMCQKIE